MTVKAPNIDARDAADVAGQVKDLLAVYAPQWEEFDPSTGKPQGMSAALINIFSRYCEIVIQRLNEVPNKNFLAFLDLLGESLQPPQPARVPLTFTLAAGSTEAAVVPPGTQAAAPPAEGEKDPVVFETERELVVTPAQLDAIYTREPDLDRYADYGALITEPALSGVPVFQGNRQIEHILYLGSDRLLGFSSVNALKLTFTLAVVVPDADARKLKWEFWDGSAWQEKTPVSDGTINLAQNGIVDFGGVAAVPLSVVNGRKGRWMRCRLITPVFPGNGEKEGMIRAGHLPAINAVKLQADLIISDLSAQQAFCNQQAADLSKAFSPFGEKPKFEDTLYIASSEAFSKVGAKVTLTITLVNPAGGTGTPLPPVVASEDLKIKWEYWSGMVWRELGTAEAGKDVITGSDPSAPDFKDTTRAFTKNGEVILTLSEEPASVAVNGVEGYWVRARIISGNYGKEAYYTLKTPNTPADGYVFNPSTFAPPSLGALTLGYTATIQDQQVEAALRFNDSEYEDIADSVNDPAQAVRPFEAAHDDRPALYLGFRLPAGMTSFPNRTMSIFNRVADYKYGEAVPQAVSSDPGAPAERLEISWEYWNGSSWARLTAQDDSENFTRPGIVGFLPPGDIARRSEFGKTGYWFRAVWQGGDFPFVPRLNRILLNTIMASQTMTIKNEILGSSDQSESQKFATVRKPVLSGQHLEVREPEIPTADDRESLENDEGPDAVSVIADAAGRPKEIWVRWHEVPDFYGSGPRDRHYVIDHLGGEIRFGDGLNGMIPPRGSGNLRMKQYRAGGGAAGNRAAGTVAQLKTTVPYVEKVINTEASAGGADAEAADSLLERAPRTIRHRGRAVTLEDCEDLAMLASPEVARARCVPLRNLAADPLGDALAPGEISVIVVPRSEDVKPLPSLELISRTQDYVAAHGVPTANISVVGPLYVQVDVTVEIALVSLEGAGAVEEAVRSKLAEFLHPLTGGLDGSGWDFGREPYKSDLYALIEAVPGVDHIRALSLDEKSGYALADVDAVKKTGRFLVCSGNHQVSLVFE